MTTLMRIRGGDPFKDYPALHTIWPAPYHLQAMEASKEFATTGELFYIIHRHEVAGITGYWREEDNPRDVFLRWSGVVHHLRRQRLGMDAIYALLVILRKAFPEAERLIELVPDNEYGHTVAMPFFTRIGFKPCEVAIPAGEGDSWPLLAMSYNLRGPR